MKLSGLFLCSNFQFKLFAVILIVNRFSSQILIAGKSIGFHPLPPYLRFDTVRVDYREDYDKGLGAEDAEKCDWMRLMVLEPIKKALIGAKCEFLWQESYMDGNMLLNHIAKDLIPMCNNSCSYMFHIEAYSGVFYDPAKSKLSNIICTILQKLAPITCCSKVEFTLITKGDYIQTQLPVEIISNWFNRVIDGQKQKLKIEMTIGISNLSEMVEHIKKVLLFLIGNYIINE